jgi:hypothetical protein
MKLLDALREIVGLILCAFGWHDYQPVARLDGLYKTYRQCARPGCGQIDYVSLQKR